MKSALLSAILPALGVAFFMYISRNTQPITSSSGGRLKRTLIINVLIAVYFAAHVGMWFALDDKLSNSDYRALVFLLIGSGIGGAFLVWYFCLRVVYWNDEGIGTRGAAPSRFIRWHEIEYAGYGWDHSYLVRSATAKIRYSAFDGGHVQLTRIIADRAPQSAVKFDDLPPTSNSGA